MCVYVRVFAKLSFGSKPLDWHKMTPESQMTTMVQFEEPWGGHEQLVMWTFITVGITSFPQWRCLFWNFSILESLLYHIYLDFGGEPQSNGTLSSPNFFLLWVLSQAQSHVFVFFYVCRWAPWSKPCWMHLWWIEWTLSSCWLKMVSACTASWQSVGSRSFTTLYGYETDTRSRKFGNYGVTLFFFFHFRNNHPTIQLSSTWLEMSSRSVEIIFNPPEYKSSRFNLKRIVLSLLWLFIEQLASKL